MKETILASLLCCCLLLMGCPLQTDSPILGDTVTPIPNWLPGVWTELKGVDVTANTYDVRRVRTDSSKLSITGLDKDGKADPDNVREAVISSVRKQMFISIYDPGDDQANSPGYYHYAVSHAKNGDLLLVPLTELLLASNTSSEDLSDYIVQHASTSDYLDRDHIEHFRKLVTQSTSSGPLPK